MKIKRFIISKDDASLTILFINGESACLRFEYLRISTPEMSSSAKQKTLITHKKSVLLNVIENVGKHGYRFIFDDQHSAIYASEYLTLLVSEQKQRWQYYLNELKASGHSREALINITQL